jgi:hypothetical protein
VSESPEPGQPDASSPAVTPPPPTRVRGRKRRFALRWSERGMLLVAAAIAGLLLTFFTIDIGQHFGLKHQAEERASKFMGRPMHIGKLSAYLRPGDFELDDVVIEGLTPDARPFLKAKRLFVHVPWWTIFGFQVKLDVKMTDWTMLIEQWPDGHHSFPRFTLPGGGPKKGPSRFTTTVDSVYADRGEFIYEDHGTPWSVDARNLSVDLVHAPNLMKTLGSQYVGRARFGDGTVQILDFLPMRTDLGASFYIDGHLLKLPKIDLLTDGGVTRLNGEVDLSRWPEQTYQVDSRLDFKRMREIFFARDAFRLSGEGRFQGIFHLFHGGRELKGDFSSAVAGLNELLFPNLRGSLDWLPKSFTVSNATSALLGGRMSLKYDLQGFGNAGGADALFAARYVDLDVSGLAKYVGVQQLDLTGTANGQGEMRWKNGHFHDTYRATGATEVQPPPNRHVAESTLPEPALIVLPDETFNDHKPIGTLPVGAELSYVSDKNGLEFAPGWVATPSTYVSFSGHVGTSGDHLNLPAHVVSKDWQASDRLLAAILTERHVATKAIDVGGRGTFDGVMTESFKDFHATGKFSGESIWAFGVRWARVTGDVAIADNFVTVAHGMVGEASAPAHIGIDGRFSIGANAPEDELRGTFNVEHWPLTDFKAAFHLSTWPVNGTASATLDLHGPYHEPAGTGTLRIDQGTAWDEPFDVATADLSFESTGLLLNGIQMLKGTGRMHGSALVNWDNTYSFDASGDHVGVETLHNFKVPEAPLSGQLDFHVSGAASFDTPGYRFDGHVADLYAGDEGVGDATGTLTVHGNDMLVSNVVVEGRVQATGQGRISIVKPYDADLTLAATDASIDPFLKFVMTNPPDLFRAAVSGTMHLTGPLAEPTSLVVDTHLSSAKLQLFNYDLQNDGEIHLTYRGDTVSIDTLNLQGNDTKLTIRGSGSHATRSLDLRADGDANLAILQAFKGFGDLSLGGSATISARLVGQADHPQFSGEATLHDGQLRFPALTRRLESLNGTITFQNGDLNLDGLRGRMGEGDIQFGGVLRFDGFKPLEYQLTAEGRGVRLRYPEGFETTATANLWMRGPVAQPTLGGNVEVTNVRYVRPLSADASILGLAAGGASTDAVAVAPAPQVGDLSLAYDIHVRARSMPFVQTREVTVYGSADDLTVRGTVDQPIITGRIELDRGDLFFNGNRYRLVAGSIDFTNPLRTEPFFDLQATTQVHVQQQTFTINGHVSGSGVDISCGAAAPDCDAKLPKMNVQLTSEPLLSQLDIFALLLGGTTDPNSTERRQLESPQAAQEQLLASMVAQIAAAPLSSRVGDIVNNVIPLDTIQFVPLFGLDSGASTSRNASARVTLGKAVSDKFYLTYSRDVTTALELYILEYTQNDRVSWVLSRNEDHTFALDFRIRHIF